MARTPNLRILTLQDESEQTHAWNTAAYNFGATVGHTQDVAMNDADVSFDEDDLATTFLFRLYGYQTAPRTMTLPPYRTLVAVENRTRSGRPVTVSCGGTTAAVPCWCRDTLYVDPANSLILLALRQWLPVFEFRAGIDTTYTSGKVIGRFVAAAWCVVRAGLPGSYATCGTAPAAARIFELRKNNVKAGSVSFVPGATAGVLAAGADIVLGSSDVLTLVAPSTVDAALAAVDVVILAEGSS